jgi:hypothetical protein
MNEFQTIALYTQNFPCRNLTFGVPTLLDTPGFEKSKKQPGRQSRENPRFGDYSKYHGFLKLP